MNNPRLHVMWICGAASAGKSVAAWELFAEFAAANTRVAYVDIDQLGMLYPEADDDVGWHHAVKGEALAAVLPGYVAAGARLLVVSRVIDPRVGPRRHLPPNTDLTLCLLSPGPTALRRRILERGWSQADADEAVAEDALLADAQFVDIRIETAALSVAETIARLRAFAHFDDQARKIRTEQVTSASGVAVLVLTGPRAAGSSTVGFELARRQWRAGRKTGFLDLRQLGFISRNGRTAYEAALAVDHLAAMHDLMTDHGAELVIVSGRLSTADRALVRAALPRAQITTVRLLADEPTLTEHVRARVNRDDARLAGDDLLGADREHQAAVVAAALAEQHILDSSAVDDLVLDISGRTPDEAVAHLKRLTSTSHEPRGGY